MYQIKDFDKYKVENLYQESPQPNKLRWMALKYIGDNTFQPVSTVFRCKDYFNDIIAAHHFKAKITVYKFKIEPQEFFNFDWIGCPVLLLNVEDDWLKHVTYVLNPYLEKQGMPPIAPIKVEQGYFVNIPKEYMKNTLRISTLTLFMRILNQPTPIGMLLTGTPEIMLEKFGRYNDVENNLTQTALKKPMGKMHPDLEPYIFQWLYGGIGAATNSMHRDKPFNDALIPTLHGCGTSNWQWKSV
jgi:hypothetical protein